MKILVYIVAIVLIVLFCVALALEKKDKAENSKLGQFNYCRRCGNILPVRKDVCISCGFEPTNGYEYCQQCGAATKEGQKLCVQCGEQLLKPGIYEGSGNGDGWFWLLGFILPVVGLLIYILWYDTQPNKAKASGNGALASVIVVFIFALFYWILIASFF